MDKKTVQDLELAGKRVVMRADFNVPLEDGQISDDIRITAALPTIRWILEHGASLVLMSHLGRPKGTGFEEAYSLKPVAERLRELLDADVQMADDCRGPAVAAAAEALQPGQVLVLENTRFYAEEVAKVDSSGMSDDEAQAAKADMKIKQGEMAKELAALGDIYVNDAFGTAHRAHASTSVIAEHMDVAVAGFLMEKELKFLGNAVANPARPFVAVIGGAKISGKLQVLRQLIGKVDTILIGGGMAYTFMKAQGKAIGTSLVEDDLMATSLETLAAAKERNTEILLPSDNVISDDFSPTANTRVESGDYPDEWMGMDIGPLTIERFTATLAKAKTILWNGPMGCFEMAPFAVGTNAVCKAVADADAISIIGGGDSASAVKQSGLAEQMTHISTGGGASLEFLEGKELPGVAVLDPA